MQCCNYEESAVKAIVDARQRQCNAQVRQKRVGGVAIELEM